LHIHYWTLFVGAILLVTAALILVSADGQVEGIVSYGICLLAGSTNVIYGLRLRPATPEPFASR